MKNKINITFDEDITEYKKIFLNNTQITNWIESVAKKINQENFEVSIYFCSDVQIKNLNKEYRNLDEVTDVLSFSQLEGEEFITNNKRNLLGDIAISLPQTKRQAIEDGHDFIAEEQMLLCHGMLHLVGYDHITDNGEMLALQAKILNELRPNVI